MAAELLLLLEKLQHPFIQALQLQACLTLCIGVIGWTLSGVRRRREALRLQAAGYSRVLQQRAHLGTSAGPEPATTTTKPETTARGPVKAAAAAGGGKGTAGRFQCAGMGCARQGSCSCCSQPLQACSADVIAARDRPQHKQRADSPAAACCSHERHQHVTCSPCADMLGDNHNHTTAVNGSTTSRSSSIWKCGAPSWPPVAVVLPVKGCRPHSRENWASQVSSQYDGQCVFIFVVESPADPAVAAVAALMQEQGAEATSLDHLQQQHWPQQGRGQQQLSKPGGVLYVWQQRRQQQQQQHAGGTEKFVVLAQAGLSSSCSQKIHNILHGIEVAQVFLHQGQLQQQQGTRSQGRACVVQQQAHHQLHACQSKQQPQQLDSTAACPAIGDGSSNNTSGSGSSSCLQQCAVNDCSCVCIHAVSAGSSGDGSSAAAAVGHAHTTTNTAAAAAAGEVLTSSSSAASMAASSSATAAGGAAAVGGYVCVLDDDVLLHPLGLMQLVDELEADQSLFMATGYPFDIVADRDSSSSSSSSKQPSAFGRLLSYAAASYHLPLTIGFSIADQGSFVWGGVMLLRVAALQEQPPLHLWQHPGQQQRQQQQQRAGAQNILQVWREGGYSDDLLLAAYCVEQGLRIALPASALYPQLLPPSITFKQYWNYLRRQLFVLDTYYNAANRTTNYVMMVLHSYGSAVFTAAVAATALQLLLLAAVAAGCCCCWLLPWLLRQPAASTASWSFQQTAASILAAGCGQLGTCLGNISSSSRSRSFSNGAVWESVTGAAAAVVSPGLVAFMSSVLAAYLSVRFLSRQCLLLLGVLSPSAGKQVLQPRMSLCMLWAGWVFENALLPACMAYTYCCDNIMWGGIRYRKGGGRVVEVTHPSS